MAAHLNASKVGIKVLLLFFFVVNTEDHRKYTKMAFWGTCDIPCGIAVYTQHIKNALIKIGYIVEHYPHTLDWRLVLQKAKEQQVDIVNIQVDEAIMPCPGDLSVLIHSLKKAVLG